MIRSVILVEKYYILQVDSQKWEGEIHRSEPEKIVFEKWILFPKSVFLVKNFQKRKNKKNQIFYRIFIKSFQNFLKISKNLRFS